MSVPASRSLKLHQAWPARTHPLCGGRLLLGPHWLNLLFNASLTIALAVLFCVYVAWPMHWALIIPCIALTLLTEAMLLAAATTDPGIVPRAVQDADMDRKRQRWEDERDRRITNDTRQALGMPTHNYTAPYNQQQPGYFPTAQYNGTALPLPQEQQQQQMRPVDEAVKGEEEKAMEPTDTSRVLSSTVAPAPFIDTAQPPIGHSYQPPNNQPVLQTPQPPPSPYVVPTQRIHSFDPRTQRAVQTDIPLKYCSTCHVYRPYGASHCRDCDSCVRGFDHRQLACTHITHSTGSRCGLLASTSHPVCSCLLPASLCCPDCPWIGQCVGERNHRYFVGFVLSLTVLTCYVFVVSLVDVIQAGVSDGLAGGDHIVALVECVFTFVVGWCFISLSAYQLYLIAEHTTTNAHIKEQREQRQRHAQAAWEQHRAYTQRMQGAAGPPLHLQQSSPPTPATADSSELSLVPPADDGIPVGRSGGAEEAMVGAITGSVFTTGTQPDSPTQPHPTSSPPTTTTAAQPATQAGMEHTVRLYPDAEAMRVSGGVLEAYWTFFCSPLPASGVDMDSDVLVDQHNKVVAYSHTHPAP